MLLPDKVWIPFQYFSFWDVPLTFTLRRGPDILLFDRGFEEARDDYAESYTVSSLPVEEYPKGRIAGAMLSELQWRWLGEVPVSGLEFDPSRRSCVSLESLARHRCLGIPPLTVDP